MSTQNHEDPRWGAKDRGRKAYAILKTINHFITATLDQTDWLDIGCGSGGIAAAIAPSVKSITGVDPESWVRWKDFRKSHKNLKFVNQPVENLTIDDSSMDVIICNQVYEHVPDPQFLIREIYRILKPGGYCYFAGPNLLFPIEPHVFWPLIHWLPRSFAVKIMQTLGSKEILDAYSKDYWTLNRWFDGFAVTNALPYMIKNPEEIGKHRLIWILVSHVPKQIISFLTIISPAFIFILQKPNK
jgi:2-polyprenyl-3-methyl-5-hydroxy-6-metoxy-1,4-benzoquinol methylase